jgi:hypothetical protein
MQPFRDALLAIALVAPILACHSPTSPTEGKLSGSEQHGRISGVVTIGPNCPGPQRDDHPCPTPPSAYAQRKILIYNETKSSLLFTVDIDSQGSYLIDLVPAKYTVDLKQNGVDKTSELPKVIDVTANSITQLNVNIDTGIR